MKLLFHLLALLPFALPILMVGPFMVMSQAHAETAIEIGGQKVVTLTRTATSTTKPEFTSVTLAPGRGMELLQVTANFPGKGNINVLASPDMDTIKKMFDENDTPNGDLGYRLGSVFLVPYPNRIRGKLSADGKTITTEWEGHTLTLPANNIGSKPTAERHAMHGLILKAKTENVTVKDIPGGQEVSGVIHAGDFSGHWLSKTDIHITVRLTAEGVDAMVEAVNVGSESEPMAIGWHPYLTLPSGNRTQVKVRIPASKLAEVDGYDNVFPTGKLLPVEGTRYDLRAVGGVALGDNMFDDNWSQIDWENHAATVQVIDPAAHYGVELIGLSPQIKTIQMYAPPTKQFVAIEHQDNFADPFGKEWGSMDTGMVTLKPGENTKWHVRLHVFVP